MTVIPGRHIKHDVGLIFRHPKERQTCVLSFLISGPVGIYNYIYIHYFCPRISLPHAPTIRPHIIWLLGWLTGCLHDDDDDDDDDGDDDDDDDDDQDDHDHDDDDAAR